LYKIRFQKCPLKYSHIYLRP